MKNSGMVFLAASFIVASVNLGIVACTDDPALAGFVVESAHSNVVAVSLGNQPDAGLETLP